MWIKFGKSKVSRTTERRLQKETECLSKYLFKDKSIQSFGAMSDIEDDLSLKEQMSSAAKIKNIKDLDD